MKYHYIYFIAIPLLLVVAMMLPFYVYNYGDAPDFRNGFDDGFTSIVFFTPTIIATILLLIRNHITAIIGTTIYLLALALSVFMNYMLSSRFQFGESNVGIGPSVILLVLFTATIISIIQSVKLTKNRKHKRKDSADLLDNTI